MRYDRHTVAISPHLDDAVLSAGQALTLHDNVLIVTVFSGAPASATTSYDLERGFESSAEAVSARIEEDRFATSIIGAQVEYLGFYDSQYGARHEVIEAKIHEGVGAIVRAARGRLFAPLGLVHPDHEIVTAAVLDAVTDGIELLLYEDLPARVLWPEAAAEAVATLRSDGWTVEPQHMGAGPMTTKEAACACYRSQVGSAKGLISPHAVLVPERFWRVS